MCRRKLQSAGGARHTRGTPVRHGYLDYGWCCNAAPAPSQKLLTLLNPSNPPNLCLELTSNDYRPLSPTTDGLVVGGMDRFLTNERPNILGLRQRADHLCMDHWLHHFSISQKLRVVGAAYTTVTAEYSWNMRYIRYGGAELQGHVCPACRSTQDFGLRKPNLRLANLH